MTIESRVAQLERRQSASGGPPTSTVSISGDGGRDCYERDCPGRPSVGPGFIAHCRACDTQFFTLGLGVNEKE
jgi:hypothetical protein